ncbi:hypothetical protein KMD26_gp23 [Leuconostoc phage phiMH1]|nr:hypothetical protein KMD26_gp23 [Leuconostoc phage phiMH1]ADP69207.1 hypothetical protein [Leuconostoc phage phiMH1]
MRLSLACYVSNGRSGAYCNEILWRSEMTEDENGGHGYVEHASIGNKIVHVFYADDNEGCENNDKQSVADK